LSSQPPEPVYLTYAYLRVLILTPALRRLRAGVRMHTGACTPRAVSVHTVGNSDHISSGRVAAVVVWLLSWRRTYGGARGAAAAMRASEGRRSGMQGGRQRRGRAGRELGASRRRPRPVFLSILFSLDIARCVARLQVFSTSARDSGSGCSAPIQDERLDGMCTVRAPSSALHANAGPTPHTQFCAARHRPPAAF
jgi:hypothetical protein